MRATARRWKKLWAQDLGRRAAFRRGAQLFVAATAVSTKPLMTLLVLRGFWLRVLSGGVKVGVIEAPVELGLATLSRRPARRELDGPVLAAFARTDPFCPSLGR